MTIYRRLLILTVLLITGMKVFSAETVLKQEDFETTESALVQEGWTFNGASNIREAGGNKYLEVVSNSDNYTYYDQSVEEGKIYGGTVKIKTENVATGSRGATLFYEFCDENHSAVSGGEYPTGLFGTNSEWTELRINNTLPIPEGVKYIRVYFRVEGTGTGCFDDFELFECGIFREQNFETTESALVQKGWTFNGASNIREDSSTGNRYLEVVASSGNYTYYYQPVEEGKSYGGTVKIKTENVSGGRGATLFYEFCDVNHSTVSGGIYLTGLYGTNSKWTELRLNTTSAIPSNVKYIRVYFEVEGSGTGCFDDFDFFENTLLPANQASVNDATPLFTWTPKIPGAVLLSQNSSFPENETFRFYDPTGNGITPDFALSTGTWYCKVDIFTKSICYGMGAQQFTVTETASSPVKIVPIWDNAETSAPRPLLAAKVYPAQDISSISVDFEGASATIVSTGNSTVEFRPPYDISEGVYNIEIQFSGVTGNFVYTNKSDIKTVSFRDDNIMLINNQPFFPIGAFRDPSDSLTDFTGVLEAGFNTTHAYYFEGVINMLGHIDDAKDYLDAAAANNLKVLMGVSRYVIDNYNIPGIKEYSAELKNYPALLSWYLYDEPIYRDTYGPLPDVYDAVKNIDDITPAAITYTRLTSLKREFLTKYANDVSLADPYPIANKDLYEQDFETTESALVQEGWSFNGASNIREDSSTGNKYLEVVASTGNNTSFYYPVEEGKIYGGTVKVKTENVTGGRGATLFYEFRDENYGYVSGGTFLTGLYGTNTEWTELRLNDTSPIPSNVKYIRVCFEVEGSGTGCFDDYTMFECAHLDIDDYIRDLEKMSLNNYGKPYWVIIQGHDIDMYRDISDSAVAPTPQQTRFMAHVALSTGATGLFWYFLPPSRYNVRTDTPGIWAGICSTVDELNDLIPYLTGDRSEFEIDDLPSNFRYWSASANGNRVLVLINMNDEETEIDMELDIDSSTDIEYFDGSGSAQFSGGVLEDTFPRLGVKIYIWEE